MMRSPHFEFPPIKRIYSVFSSAKCQDETQTTWKVPTTKQSSQQAISPTNS